MAAERLGAARQRTVARLIAALDDRDTEFPVRCGAVAIELERRGKSVALTANHKSHSDGPLTHPSQANRA